MSVNNGIALRYDWSAGAMQGAGSRGGKSATLSGITEMNNNALSDPRRMRRPVGVFVQNESGVPADPLTPAPPIVNDSAQIGNGKRGRGTNPWKGKSKPTGKGKHGGNPLAIADTVTKGVTEVVKGLPQLIDSAIKADDDRRAKYLQKVAEWRAQRVEEFVNHFWYWGQRGKIREDTWNPRRDNPPGKNFQSPQEAFNHMGTDGLMPFIVRVIKWQLPDNDVAKPHFTRP